jgi:hypothetical protein
MTAHKALASRLDAAIKGLLDHQWSHCRPAMSALQELIDAADAARKALAQPEPWTEAAAVDLAHRAGFAGTCWTMGPYELVHMLNMPAAPPPPARPPTAAENAVMQHAAEGG